MWVWFSALCMIAKRNCMFSFTWKIQHTGGLILRSSLFYTIPFTSIIIQVGKVCIAVHADGSKKLRGGLVMRLNILEVCDWFVITPYVHAHALLSQNMDELVAPPVGPGESKLQYSYCFWFTQRMRGSVSSAPSDYQDNIKLVGLFSTVSIT